MLKSISLENYKCFKEKTDIKIAPLTVLCGVNSSGKSSIINSLLIQKQSYEDNSVSNNMRLNGKYVKCGRFDDISSFKQNDQFVSLTFSYVLNRPIKYNRNIKKQSKQDITIFKNIAKIYPLHDIENIVINSSISIEEFNINKSVDNNILSEQKIEITINCSNKEKIESIIELKKLKGQISQYIIRLTNIPNGDTGKLVEYVELQDAACYFENFNLINAYSSNIKPLGTQVGGVLANVYLIFKMNALQFKNVHYLTPLRVYPQRNYNLDYETDDVGYSGEFTPYVMHKYQDKQIDGFLPPKNDIITPSKNKINFSNCIQEWMAYFKFGKYSLSNSLETIQLNIKDYNISNVGFGISQVLPIVVSGLIKNQNEMLLLEQPEIHLHPMAQMCMADFLISMAVNNKGVIVETHSDHIINRIVRRMMEDESIRNKVKIYFVDQNEDGISNIEDIAVDPVRSVLTNNENFFTQFATETEKIIYTGYKNKHKEG